MVLRLDPAIPLVWRDPHTLQFGVDPVLAVLPELTPAHERLVAALTMGVSAAGFRMLAQEPPLPRREGEKLLATLGPCLMPEAAAGAPRTRQAMVLGGTRLAQALARLLEETGLRLSDRRRRPGVVALVADRVVRPADHRVWLQRDVPHLPIVTGDAAVIVGPLVVPGASACLHCVALHRRDDDPAWPAIAAQLTNLPAPPAHPLRTAAAASFAAQTIASALRGEAEAGVEWRFERDGAVFSARRIEPHPECCCAAPPESDWVPDAGRAAPRPPSAARDSSWRA
ncbi:MAG: hypothetical protein DI534_11780 [Leifsonia xyli]|nr:MAG: hypothetical protein DI534_11780 [Leifsonia xyli]